MDVGDGCFADSVLYFLCALGSEYVFPISFLFFFFFFPVCPYFYFYWVVLIMFYGLTSTAYGNQRTLKKLGRAGENEENQD